MYNMKVGIYIFIYLIDKFYGASAIEILKKRDLRVLGTYL